MVLVTDKSGYDYVRSRGYEPLLGYPVGMEHRFRVELQREVFGDGHTPEENERFYRWCWNHKPHECEECLRPLEYSATHVSHILTRGAHPAIAHDPRNVNILCYRHHAMWENGARSNMRIYAGNMARIRKLKLEYYNDSDSDGKDH